jgi:hypothetical protein
MPLLKNVMSQGIVFELLAKLTCFVFSYNNIY